MNDFEDEWDNKCEKCGEGTLWGSICHDCGPHGKKKDDE